jgi:aspartate ammonia-lyase
MTMTLERLKNIPIFEKLDDEELRLFADAFKTQSIAPGEYLYRLGDTRSNMFIILSGEIEILIDRDGTSAEAVANLGEGNFLGEGVMLETTPHRTSSRATISCRVLTLDRDSLDTLFDNNPTTARKVLSAVARTVAFRLKTANYSRSGGVVFDERGATRTEHDLLGSREVPNDAYYGIQTLRAMENFKITGVVVGDYPNFVRAFAMVKKACAIANNQLGYLADDVTGAICSAADEIIDGALHHHFQVDMIQGGAGTSTNMNANEVIANRALELMGHKKGEYTFVNPNNHVNLAQSTNDAYPTAIKVALLLSYNDAVTALSALSAAFEDKSAEFSEIIKMGRTQLQDAVPMTLGQEFHAFASTITSDVGRLEELSQEFCSINIGATAIGTGINSDPDYPALACKALSGICGHQLHIAEDLIDATTDMGAFITFSGVLRRISIKLSKVCNDLRLLSSGPRCGLNEINLPAMQPGSSIMPGKVNPVIPEAANMVAMQVIANDLCVTMATEAGQLQLNVFEPVIVYNLLQSVRMLTKAANLLREKCVVGITANEEHCRRQVENSIGIITALNPYIGYQNSTSIAKEALETGGNVGALILEKQLMTREELDDIMKPENMTRPRKMHKSNT